MGNKPSNSQSEAEEPEAARLPPSGRQSRARDTRDTGQCEDGDDLEVPEVPPPMRPISSMPAQDDTASVKRVSGIKLKYAEIPLKKSNVLHHWPLSDSDILILGVVPPTPTQSSTKTSNDCHRDSGPGCHDRLFTQH